MNLKTLIEKKKEIGKRVSVQSNLDLAGISQDEYGSYNKRIELVSNDEYAYDLILLKQAALSGRKLPVSVEYSILSKADKEEISAMVVKPVKTRTATDTLLKIIDEKALEVYKKVLYYKDGYVHVTDGFVASIVEINYNKNREGLAFSSSDLKVEVKYPNLAAVKPSQESAKHFRVSAKSLISKIRGVAKFGKNFRGGIIYIKLEGTYFEADKVFKALQPIIEFGDKAIDLYLTKGSTLMAASGVVTSLVSPIRDGSYAGDIPYIDFS